MLDNGPGNFQGIDPENPAHDGVGPTLCAQKVPPRQYQIVQMNPVEGPSCRNKKRPLKYRSVCVQKYVSFR